MTKARCPNCKEFPYRWRTALTDEGTWGVRCSLCSHIRIVARRAAPKRNARNARLEATLQSLWAERTE
jgi:DNA-directed RNA polymerase subunit RPC12/RpoP